MLEVRPMRIAACVLCLWFCSADAFGQNLLWEVVEDLSGGTDLARAITLSKKSVVVIGNASNSADQANDFVIQSLRRANGAVRWTDRVPEVPGVLTALQITSAQGRVFASGYAPGAVPGSTDIVIRGYDALTGTLLWNRIWDTGRDDQPQAIVAGTAAVVVVGYGGNSPARNAVNFIVRAYDPVSGRVLWDDRLERPDLESAAWTVAITKNRVFVAGTTMMSTTSNLLVRAYNASSGALVWEMTRPSTSPVTIKAVGGRVFLAGSSSDHNYVGAFDAKSGVMLWEDAALDRGIFLDLAVDSNRVAVAGASNSALLVRAYDVGSGVMEWEAQTAVAPGFREFGATIVMNERAVYVGGTSGRDFVYSEMLVRSYDSATGTLLWDDRSHRSGSSATAVDMALGKNRLFVAGQASGVGIDFVMRAYDVRTDGTGR